MQPVLLENKEHQVWYPGQPEQLEHLELLEHPEHPEHLDQLAPPVLKEPLVH